jgi:C-terminal processing protease CtpA/Prc
VVLQNYFQGITKSLGYNYGLARISGGNDVFGFVQYVVKGSPADNAGIKRGDIFIKVNGTQLTTTNYQNLLVDSLGYTLSFANIINHTITPNGKNLILAATVVQENPVYFDTIYNVNNYKVGYLVYNGFISDFDITLNQKFSSFKAAGINKLILDLRYNGGGSIQTAIYLASMIYTTSVSQVFLKTQYNQYLQSYFLNNYGASYFTDNFTDVILQTTTTAQTPISNLGLSDLYVLTSNGTASASELIINGLKPYINVVVIGDTTVGKNVGSVTVYDVDSYGNINPKHKWAMQPIVLKINNANNHSDYGSVGFIPDVKVQEDIANLLPFGNPNEPLLSAALNYIGGLKSAPLPSKSSMYRKIADSKDRIPHSKEMYLNKNSLKNLPGKKSGKIGFLR